MSKPIPVAVIGAGHMGKHHVRTYAQLPGVKLVAVIDRDVEKARALAEPLGVKFAADYSPALGDVAAVTVAVPTIRHLEVSRPFLERGVGVLVEKPMAATVEEAEELAAIAKRSGAVLQVGHTERFNPAVRAVERLGVLPKFVETHRISPFTFRSADVGVVFDMMIHDIDIVLHLVKSDPVQVDAVGVNVLVKSEDIANARVRFANGAVANLTASRLALKTERKLRAFAENAYVSLDYQKRVGIAITLDKNIDVLKFAHEKNLEDLSQLAGTDFSKMVHVEPLLIDNRDPLGAELEAFIEAVRSKTPPPVSAEDGVRAVRLATQIVASLQTHRWDGKQGDRVGLEADIFGRAARATTV